MRKASRISFDLNLIIKAVTYKKVTNSLRKAFVCMKKGLPKQKSRPADLPDGPWVHFYDCVMLPAQLGHTAPADAPSLQTGPFDGHSKAM